MTILHPYSRPSYPMLLSWWSFSFQIHQPSYLCSWPHHLQQHWGSGRNHLPFCQCGEKQHANWAHQRLKVCIKLQAELEMLVIVYEVINRHQTTAQPSFGKWRKRYSPVTRCSKSKSHFPSFSRNFEPGLMHSSDCPSSCTFLPYLQSRFSLLYKKKPPRTAIPRLFMRATNCRPQQGANFSNKLEHDDLQGMINERWSFWQRGCTGCPFEVPCSTLSCDSAGKAPFIGQHLWQSLHS